MTNVAYVNHEFIILDASGSMRGLEGNVVKVTDALISHLASQVKVFPDQETRITVYAFSSPGSQGGGSPWKCLIWDKDVLRVPSIAGLYRTGGNTALCDTMIRVIQDMQKIPVFYGDHTFLGYLVTDGLENVSSPANVERLPSVIRGLPETWTLAGLVPGVRAQQQLLRFGFAPGNIETWDPSKRDAIEDVGEKIRVTSAAYAGARSAGTRSTRSLFTMAEPPVRDIQGTLTPMTPGSYYFEEVAEEDLAKIERGRIDQFMQLKTGRAYSPGDPLTFYQMTRRVRIGKGKRIAVAVPDHKDKTVQVYTGNSARHKLGLPDADVRVSPGRWKDYKVFVESTSFNRRLFPGTSVLVMR